MPFTQEELDDLNKAQQRYEQAATAKPGDQSLLDWSGSFIRSGLENAVNLFGVPKSASNIAWEETHPLSSTAAGFVGVGGVYGGFFKATKNLKRLDSALDKIAGVANSPVRGGAVKEALRFTPLEGARIIGTAIGEPEKLDQTLFESGVNLALAGGFGALAGLPAKFGTTPGAIREIAPNVDEKSVSTIKLRQLRELLESGKVHPEQTAKAQRIINQLDGAVRSEEYLTNPNSVINPRYITSLYDTAGNVENKLTRTSWLNSFFKPQKNKIYEVNKLVTKAEDPKFGLDSQAQVDELMARLPTHATSYMQFPRLVTLASEKANLHNLWTSRMAKYATPIGPGEWMAREADDGLFIMMKKLKGDPAKIGKGDQFLTFKTDRPDYFGGKATGWMDRQVEQGMWWARQFPQNQKALPGGAQDFIKQSVAQLPLRSFDDLTQAPGKDGFVRSFLGKLGLKPGEQTTNAVKGALAYMQENFAPQAAQWVGDGPGKLRARWLWGTIKPAMERANSLAEAMIYGLPAVKDGSSLAKQLLFHGAKSLYLKGDKTVFNLIQKLSSEDRSRLAQIQAGHWDLATVNNRHVAGDISDELHALLTQLEDLSTTQWNELNATRKTLGMPELPARKGHYMMSHMWDGDVRLRVRNEKGETIYMVGADSRGEAIKQGEKVIENAGKKGQWTFDASKQWTKDLFLRGREPNTDDVASILGINTDGSDFRRAASAMEKYVREAYDPKQLAGRQGMQGFSTDMSDKPLAERLLRHTRQMQTHITDLALRAELYPQLLKLQDENPDIFRQVQERWNNALGLGGKFGQVQNDILDQVLAPYVGNNSASKIVATANTVQHNLQLGSFNFMYPTVNMLSFMTTVLPQVSFVGSAEFKTLAQYYTSILAHGSDGLAKRAVHTLDPLKMVYRGFNLMGKPDAEMKGFFEKAMGDGLFAPRLVEEHIGVDAQLKTRLSGVLKEKDGFVKFLQYLSEWMPNKSEQFSRLHAFTTGVATGRDLLGLRGEGLYKFAKEFTTNTMFGYGLVDRAKVIQGPLGSFFGLYKNWQMHYISWMLAYAGQAGRGNMGPLLWSHAGTAAVGGIGGTSAYGLADGFSRIATGESAFSQIYDMFSVNEDGKPDLYSDTAFYGLPALLGVSLQASASSFGANPAKDAGMLFSFVQAERGAAVGKAVGGAIDTWVATGQNPFSDKLVRDQFLKAVAPRSVIRTSQVLEGDYIRSMNTGNPLIQGLSPMERFIYGSGFNTPEIDRTFKVSDELYNSTEKRKAAMRYYARQLLDLQDSGDWKNLTALSRQIAASGVGMDSVLRSADSMRKRNLKDIAEYRLRKTSPDFLSRFVDETGYETDRPEQPSDEQASPDEPVQ